MTRIPGTLVQLVVGDFNGDGKSRPGRNSPAPGHLHHHQPQHLEPASPHPDASGWLATSTATGRGLPGRVQPAPGQIYIHHQPELPGPHPRHFVLRRWPATSTATGKPIWPGSTAPGTSTTPPIGAPGPASPALWFGLAWPGDFTATGQDLLAGVNSVGAIWNTTNRKHLDPHPVLVPQPGGRRLHGDGKADLAGPNSAGRIDTTTNRSTWTPICVSTRLAGVVILSCFIFIEGLRTRRARHNSPAPRWGFDRPCSRWPGTDSAARPSRGRRSPAKLTGPRPRAIYAGYLGNILQLTSQVPNDPQ
ncbi:MAG: hypothetical protein U5O69_10375 [Candidatus Competibacteraceae bacterium]|nr:hypothetical protein [Candidatus Competibacteraceae bacterium]